MENKNETEVQITDDRGVVSRSRIFFHILLSIFPFFFFLSNNIAAGV